MDKNIKKNTLNDNVSILPNIEYSVITKEIRDKIGSLPLGIMGKEGTRCFYINNHKFAKEVTESCTMEFLTLVIRLEQRNL